MIIRRMTYLRGAALHNVANELVSIAINASGGDFKVTFGGQETSDLAFDISVADFKTAIDGLSSVTVGDFNYSGGPGVIGGGTPYYIVSTSLANIGAFTSDGAGLTGSPDTSTVVVEEGGGNLRSIRYSHVPTANTRIQAVELIRFYDTRGNAIEVHPLFFTIDQFDSKAYININRGSSTPTADDYDILVATGDTTTSETVTAELSQGVVSIANISVFLDTGFGELLVPGHEWSLTAWDPKGHIYDT